MSFQLFNTCIETSEKCDELEGRLKILLKNCTENIYENIAR